jgi:hypothetical protein
MRRRGPTNPVTPFKLALYYFDSLVAGIIAKVLDEYSAGKNGKVDGACATN